MDLLAWETTHSESRHGRGDSHQCDGLQCAVRSIYRSVSDAVMAFYAAVQSDHTREDRAWQPPPWHRPHHPSGDAPHRHPPFCQYPPDGPPGGPQHPPPPPRQGGPPPSHPPLPPRRSGKGSPIPVRIPLPELVPSSSSAEYQKLTDTSSLTPAPAGTGPMFVVVLTVLTAPTAPMIPKTPTYSHPSEPEFSHPSSSS